MNVSATQPTKRHPPEEMFDKFYYSYSCLCTFGSQALLSPSQHKSFLYGTHGWIEFLSRAAVHQTEY